MTRIADCTCSVCGSIDVVMVSPGFDAVKDKVGPILVSGQTGRDATALCADHFAAAVKPWPSEVRRGRRRGLTA